MLINELFNSKGSIEVNNLKPKAKIPYLWKINAPGNDNLLFRLGAYAKDTQSPKVPKSGDKHIQLFLMSLSDKGNVTMLRNGLGTKPIDVLNTIFDTVFPIIRKHKIETIAFRFPTNKMKGQVPVLIKIIDRIVKTKTSGAYEYVTDVQGTKDSFILVKAKNADFSSMGVETNNLEDVRASLLNDEVKKSYIGAINSTKLSKADILVMQAGSVGMTATTKRAEEDLWVSELPSTPLINSELKQAISYKFDDEINNFVHYSTMEDIERLGDNAYILTDFANEVNTKGNILDYKIWERLFDKLHKEGEDLYEEYIGELIGHLAKLHGRAVSKYYDDISRYFRSTLTEAQKKSIKEYTGDAYSSINSSLRDDNYGYEDFYTKEQTDEFIDTLDECFIESPCTLAGVTVYRSHDLMYNGYMESLINNKLYYFRNYVSTSLSPYIMSTDISQTMRGERRRNKVMFIIELDDRVPVLIPGGLSQYESEVEVILPRGTVLKVDKFSHGEILAAYCKVVPINELTEEEQKEYVYMRFIDFINENVTKADKKPSKKVHDYFPKRDDLPERFYK